MGGEINLAFILRRKEYVDMFKRFFRKNKDEVENRIDIRIDILEEQINKQKVKLDSYDSRITDIIDENRRLKRILENYIPGKITYQNMSKYLSFTYNRDVWCFIYKDGKEFCINDMRLNDPSFTERNDSGQKDIIYVKDDVSIDEKTEYREYVIDLNNCTFIREK